MADISHSDMDFRRIYMLWHDRMLLWAARYFSETQDCEDAVHDAFLRLLKRPSLVRDAGNGPRLEGLLRIVLRSSCLDLLKKRHEFPADDEYFGNLTGPRKEQPEESLAEKDSLDRAVVQLPDETRDILTLAYLYGYTPAEIAKLIGKKEGAVRKALQRGKKKLYALLEEEGS